jgi:hypothetical protein
MIVWMAWLGLHFGESVGALLLVLAGILLFTKLFIRRKASN